MWTEISQTQNRSLRNVFSRQSFGSVVLVVITEKLKQQKTITSNMATASKKINARFGTLLWCLAYFYWRGSRETFSATIWAYLIHNSAFEHVKKRSDFTNWFHFDDTCEMSDVNALYCSVILVTSTSIFRGGALGDTPPKKRHLNVISKGA